MASRIVFQGVTADSHAQAVKHLLAVPNPERVIFSTAFLNKAGLLQLSTALTPLASLVTILAGVRNGITSAQGLLASLAGGYKTYAVDTGSRKVIFHPKIFFARGAAHARVVLGSANLTMGGLHRNIEASIAMDLDLAVQADAAFAGEIEKKLDDMIGEYPEHVFLLGNVAAVRALLKTGRVVDESVTPAPTPGGSSSNRDGDTVPIMKLKSNAVAEPKIDKLSGAAVAPEAEDTGVPAAPIRDHVSLAWQSKPLSRRYLTIPTEATTHATGSMLFTKGTFDEIDQRHYFRDEVFSDLKWEFDTTPGKKHMERAEAGFRLVIRDVNYGTFKLRLSHNSKTNTAAYNQSNSMTQLHWGDARKLVAKEDLLGRTLNLFRDEDAEPPLFIIEID